jgi:hypothetical protein
MQFYTCLDFWVSCVMITYQDMEYETKVNPQ